ncbi:hypothetical protein EMIT0P100_20506 [Pseudomonas sp. IT-P100]
MRVAFLPGTVRTPTQLVGTEPPQLPHRQLGSLATGTERAGIFPARTGKLALQQWASGAGCGVTGCRVVSVAGLLRAGIPEKRRTDFAAGCPPTAEHCGVGALSTATTPVAEGSQVGGLFEGRVGRAAGVSDLRSKERSLPQLLHWKCGLLLELPQAAIF